MALAAWVALVAAACIPALAAAKEADAAGGAMAIDPMISLRPLPTRLYKTRDSGHERTESWTLWLLVETGRPRALAVQGVDIQLLAGKQVTRSVHLGEEGTKALTIKPPFPPKRPDGSAPPSPIYWPQAVRLRFTEAAAAKVDAMNVSVELAEEGKTVRAVAMLPLETFTQKTSLVYPFKGRGIITQAGVTNGGHRNRSGQFALDGVGLDKSYAMYLPGGGEKREDHAGWGRALIAPADGTVVRARGDRPDQPDPEKSDPKYYAPEHPNGGDPGNHVVIDHGNGEFSMIAHLQEKSLRVKVGDRVRQGQELGKLGSSGDTVTPHVHYQLQSGPDIEWSDGLPCTFVNIDDTLVRGTFFRAK